MAAMSMGDYGKPAPSGGGIRLRVLYDAIVNRELIDVETGGKALIMTSDEVIEDMKMLSMARWHLILLIKQIQIILYQNTLVKMYCER